MLEKFVAVLRTFPHLTTLSLGHWTSHHEVERFFPRLMEAVATPG
jgi:hypothetical protein